MMSQKKPSTTSPAYPVKTGPFNPATADDILESMDETELSNYFIRQVEHMTECFANFRRDYAKDVERRQKVLPSKKKRPAGQL